MQKPVIKVHIDEDIPSLETFKLKLSYKIKHQDPSIIINDSRCLFPGEFGCITGLPGSGKSSIIESFICAFIKERWGLTGIDTLGIHFNATEGKCAIIDTERTPDDNRVSLYRIEKRLKADKHPHIIYNDEIKGLSYFMMSEIPSISQLKDYLSELYYTNEYRFIIIDGILDFVASLNDDENTKEVIQWIRGMGVKFDVTTLMTLHPNKGTDIMAGHLGSNIYRWARMCMLVRSTDQDKTVKELTTHYSMGKMSKDDPHNFIPVYFKWSNEQRMMVLADKPEETIYSMKAITKIFDLWLAAGKGKKIPSKDLAEQYSDEIGVKHQTARKHIQGACKDDKLSSEGTTSNTVYYLEDEIPF